jgi:hypothetical protein
MRTGGAGQVFFFIEVTQLNFSLGVMGGLLPPITPEILRTLAFS